VGFTGKTHCNAPSKHIHHKHHSIKEQGKKPKQAEQLLHTSISGHSQARLEADAAGPTQHAGICLITKELSSNESYTDLSQRSCDKRSARNTSDSGSLVSKLMQELHCRQAQASE
jgi:hypothetical protein